MDDDLKDPLLGFHKLERAVENPWPQRGDKLRVIDADPTLCVRKGDWLGYTFTARVARYTVEGATCVTREVVTEYCGVCVAVLATIVVLRCADGSHVSAGFGELTLDHSVPQQVPPARPEEKA